MVGRKAVLMVGQMEARMGGQMVGQKADRMVVQMEARMVGRKADRMVVQKEVPREARMDLKAALQVRLEEGAVLLPCVL
tara:strand:- start:2190 stop:2426 length:237 start_codon:yes stop_codon:yes gene_type:complete